MPNRIIKESIKSSEEVDALDWFQEAMFVRLITTVDDYGCFEAKPKLLRNVLFPLKDNVTVEMVSDALDALERVNIIKRYEHEGKEYLYFTTWMNHQRIRNKKGKFPEPYDGYFQSKASECDDDEEKPSGKKKLTVKRPSNDSNSLTNDSNSPSNDSNSRPESNPIQSNPKRKGKEKEGPYSFIDDLEGIGIQEVHDEIFDEMKKAGFQMNDNLRTEALRLLEEHGKEKLVYAIRECSGATGNKLLYLRGVLSGKKKKRGAVDREEADISDALRSILGGM